MKHLILLTSIIISITFVHGYAVEVKTVTNVNTATAVAQPFQGRPMQITIAASTTASSDAMRAMPPRGTVTSGNMMTVGVNPVMMYPMTEDEATNVKVKALATEMETKIEAIRTDYNARIKAAIGTKKVISGAPVMMTGRAVMTTSGTGSSQVMEVHQMTEEDMKAHNTNMPMVHMNMNSDGNANYTVTVNGNKEEGFGMKMKAMFMGLFGK